MTAARKISVLIVTGFLGAGKTTFINHLIQVNRSKKLALLENEFGEESVDTSLITGIDGNRIFELSNGCICCSITNEFSVALTELSNQLAEIDCLLIETSGVADLSQVIRPFLSDRMLNDRYRLIGSVCVVDAVNYEKMIELPAQQMQLIHSDYVLINKSEEVSAGKIESIRRSITAFNSSAHIETTSFAQTCDFSLDTLDADIQEKLEKKLSAPVMFRVVEMTRFSTFTHRFAGRINLEKFRYWFDYFAAINQTDIYRIKGILFADKEVSKTIVQSVGGSTRYSEGSIIRPGEEIENTLVFIGRNIDFSRIVLELEDYLTEDENPEW